MWKSRITIAMILALPLAAGCKPERESVMRRNTQERSAGVAPLHLTDDNFRAEIVNGKQPVLVDFWASRCPPCLKMKPAVRELAADFVGRATVAELDVDANSLMPDRYDVRQLPTVLIFSNGEVVNRFVGLQTKDQLAQALDAEIDPP